MAFVEYEEVEVPVAQLKPGMYVTALDRPWLDTPFLVQGFTIESDREIQQLAKYCKFVKIDKKTIHDEAIQYRPPAPEQPPSTPEQPPSATDKTLQMELPQATPGQYQDQSSLKQELPKAQSAQEEVETNLHKIYDDIDAGKQVDLTAIKSSVNSMVSSVLRNPDAMIWLTLLKRKGGYDYRHALGSSIWAVSLGRQLGLPQHELNTLALGSLMCDIGKSKIDKRILNKPGALTDREFELIKRHVAFSVTMLRNHSNLPKEILAIVACHHERYNGSGYPRSLAGAKIPVFARIVGLADCYDALTSPRCYAPARSPSEAIKRLYDWRGNFFQAEIIEEFIQAIGLYPAGSLIELTNGAIAVVVAEGRRQRLHPKVMCLLGPDKKMITQPVIIDLALEAKKPGDQALHIKAGVAPEDYGIDLDELYL